MAGKESKKSKDKLDLDGSGPADKGLTEKERGLGVPDLTELDKLRGIGAFSLPLEGKKASSATTILGQGSRSLDTRRAHHGVNPTIDTNQQPLSTFAAYVGTASFSMARAYLERRELPPEGSVRVEEVVSAFDYGYSAPRNATFAIHAEAAPSATRPGYHVLHIGVQGRHLTPAMRKPANLVFVVDVSGSMASPGRLELVKQSLGLLVRRLRATDTVGIVTYGSTARVLLTPTRAHQRRSIDRAIAALRVQGATHAYAGLKAGYALAAAATKSNTINRVVLCSDGVFDASPAEKRALLAQVEQGKRDGMTLTTIGFGMGPFNDPLMEQLAARGDGSYHYVDRLDQARRVLVEQVTGSLQVIAKDVKLQVRFEPKAVLRYRLIGYESRTLNAADFANPRVGGGEVGAGRSMTALYEVKLRSVTTASIGTVRVRYFKPGTNQSELVERALPAATVRAHTALLSPGSQLAILVAQFGEKLRGSPWMSAVQHADIEQRIGELPATVLERPAVAELRRLAGIAAALHTANPTYQDYDDLAVFAPVRARPTNQGVTTF